MVKKRVWFFGVLSMVLALFLISLNEYSKLIKLVLKAAKKENGIGQIHHEGSLVFECNSKGEKTNGSWCIPGKEMNFLNIGVN